MVSALHKEEDLFTPLVLLAILEMGKPAVKGEKEPRKSGYLRCGYVDQQGMGLKKGLWSSNNPR